MGIGPDYVNSMVIQARRTFLRDSGLVGAALAALCSPRGIKKSMKLKWYGHSALRNESRAGEDSTPGGRR